MRRILAVTALSLLAGGGSPVAQIGSLDRQRLLAHLDMTAAWLVDETSGLSAAQLEFRRAPDTWNVAQVVEHLVVVAPIYWQDLQQSLKESPGGRTTSMTDADVLWYGIDRTHREQAIPTERPTAPPRDVRVAFEEYRKYHDRLRQYISTTRDELRRHFVQRQQCDAYQWALLISTHEQRHILQIREIKADPKFPKASEAKPQTRERGGAAPPR
jgi:hypothetical protein